MGMITRCSIIIYDDFGNVLIAERGKRNETVMGKSEKQIEKEKERNQKRWKQIQNQIQ